MTYTIQPHGVCSRSMTVETDDQGVIQKLEVVGGCDGNLKGISALVVGMKAEEAVRRLPEELRAVVILRYFAGYTQAETAAALNIPQGTAATRQKRALALLKLELGEEGQA